MHQCCCRHVLDLHVETTGGVQTVTMYEVNRFVSSEPSGALQDTGLPSLAVYSSAGGGGGGGGDPNCGVVPSPTPAPSVEAGYCPLNTPESSLSMVLASPPTAVTANLDTTLQDMCVIAPCGGRCLCAGFVYQCACVCVLHCVCCSSQRRKLPRRVPPCQRLRGRRPPHHHHRLHQPRPGPG